MSGMSGQFLFQLPGLGLWADEEILGSSFEGTYEDTPVRLDLPARDDDFGLDRDDRHELSALGGGSASKDDVTAVAVAIVRVVAYSDETFGSDDFRDRASAPFEQAHAAMTRLLAAASGFLESFVLHVRADLGHHWMGTTRDPIERTWLASLIDEETGERIPVGPGALVTAYARDLESRVTAKDIAVVVERVARGEAVSLPEELMAEAKYLAWIRDPPDLRVAVIFAAVACESKIKRMLSLGAEHDQAKSVLVDLILENPRDVTMAIITHVDKTAAAIFGRSLRIENKDLYKRTDKLFQVRNVLAHGKAVQPSDTDMRDAVRAGVETFAWIAGLKN